MEISYVELVSLHRINWYKPQSFLRIHRALLLSITDLLYWHVGESSTCSLFGTIWTHELRERKPWFWLWSTLMEGQGKWRLQSYRKVDLFFNTRVEEPQKTVCSPTSTFQRGCDKLMQKGPEHLLSCDKSWFSVGFEIWTYHLFKPSVTD